MGTGLQSGSKIRIPSARMAAVEIATVLESKWRHAYLEVLSAALRGDRDCLVQCLYMAIMLYGGVCVALKPSWPALVLPVAGWAVPLLWLASAGLSVRANLAADGTISPLLLFVPLLPMADKLMAIVCILIELHLWLQGGWFVIRIIGLLLLVNPLSVTVFCTWLRLSSHTSLVGYLPQLLSSYIGMAAALTGVLTGSTLLCALAPVLCSRELLLRLGMFGYIVRLRINSCRHGFMVL